jgi:hypothetical protein
VTPAAAAVTTTLPADANAVSSLPQREPAPSPVAKPAQKPSPAAAKSRRRLVLVSAAAVVAIAASIAGVVIWRGATAAPPPGILVIDAVPWGVVTSIENGRGEHVAVPASASTPFSLSLPAGSYHIVLTGPPPESKRADVTATVTPAGTIVAPRTEFQVITPEQYFTPYLAAATTADVSTDAGSSTTKP